MDFRDWAAQDNDHRVLRWVTNEVMGGIQQITGQTYVDVYASRVKRGDLKDADLGPYTLSHPNQGQQAPTRTVDPEPGRTGGLRFAEPTPTSALADRGRRPGPAAQWSRSCWWSIGRPLRSSPGVGLARPPGKRRNGPRRQARSGGWSGSGPLVRRPRKSRPSGCRAWSRPGGGGLSRRCGRQRWPGAQGPRRVRRSRAGSGVPVVPAGLREQPPRLTRHRAPPGCAGAYPTPATGFGSGRRST